MRFKCFIILFTIIFPLLSQNSPSNNVDSLLDESHKKFTELKFIESSKIARQALDLSVLNNYSKGIVMSKIYIAKVLIDIGLNMEALKYLEGIDKEPFFIKEPIPKVETHRLKGRIYGIQKLYSLSKEEFKNQLLLSENILDSKKRNLSKLWAYQNLEHLFFLQSLNDSIEVYQNLQEELLLSFKEEEAFYNISTLHTSKAKLYLNKADFEAANEELQKSIDMLEKHNIPYIYDNLQVLGNLESMKGNVNKAIDYYSKALNNSLSLNATYTSRNLHKRLSDYMLENDTLVDRARKHKIEYNILNDSLESHNKMVVNSVLENIINDKDRVSDQKARFFRYTIIVIIFCSFIIGVFLILRIKRNKKKLSIKNKQLATKSDKIELLEEELENNIFQDIIELAKSNSPEFLPLFGKGYPDFVEEMKKLDPSIRSSELYFCALAYLNFSTKDIASFTFVTTRAVQVRKNRMRKKYHIPSEVDFNQWFRNLKNGGLSIEKKIEE